MFKNKSFESSITTASQIMLLIVNCAELQLKATQHEIHLLENPNYLNHYFLLTHLLDITQLLASTADSLQLLCNFNKVSNYHLNYYVRPYLGILSSLSMVLINIPKYLQPNELFDLMIHENLLKIPEIQQYLLEPNPEDPEFHLKFFIGKFLENLSSHTMCPPLSLISNKINYVSMFIKKPVNYLNKISTLLFSWEAWIRKNATTSIVFPTLMLPKILPFSHPIYLNAICFQKTTQILFALGDTLVNQEQDREYYIQKHQLKLMATQGNVAANYYLGRLYSYEKNLTTAIQHYQIAAENNHLAARAQLTSIYASKKQTREREFIPEKTPEPTIDLITLGKTIIYLASMGLFIACPHTSTTWFLSSALLNIGRAEYLSTKLAEKSSNLRGVRFFCTDDVVSQDKIFSEGIPYTH